MHTVSGKIYKAPFVKPGCGPQQDSTMFVVELTETIKDFRDPNVKHYANYRAAFFAKTPNALSYYNQVFVEGAFVVIGCEKLKVEQREHNGQTYVTLNMDNPRLEGAMYPEGQQQQQPAPHQQNAGWGAPQQPAQQQQNNNSGYQQQPNSNNKRQQLDQSADFDDD